MPPFDTDAYLATLEPPSFTVGGRTFTGRILSALEQQHFEARFAALEVKRLSDGEVTQLIRDYVSALFPAPPPRATRHWLGLRRRVLPQVAPVDVFCALPLAVQLACIQDFARCLAMALPTPGGAMVDGSAERGEDTRLRSGSP